MKFLKTEVSLPLNSDTVLVRGWGENKKHYIYEFAKFTRTRTGHCWQEDDADHELWFVPHEWAKLPQPKAGQEQ